MKLSKEEFKEYIKIIQELDKKIESLYDILNYSLVDDLCEFYSGLINWLDNILKCDWVDFYVYETNFGEKNTKIYNDAMEVIADINSADSLYDFIKECN